VERAVAHVQIADQIRPCGIVELNRAGIYKCAGPIEYRRNIVIQSNRVQGYLTGRVIGPVAEGQCAAGLFDKIKIRECLRRFPIS